METKKLHHIWRGCRSGYGYAIYFFSGPMLDFESFGSLAGVKNLFTLENAVLIGWIHYLAFDLLVGNWIINQGQGNNIIRWLITPVCSFALC